MTSYLFCAFNLPDHLGAFQTGIYAKPLFYLNLVFFERPPESQELFL